MAAFETQGRFIQSRYGSEGPQGSLPRPVPEEDGNGATVDS
jgi:hypothetical protein